MRRPQRKRAGASVGHERLADEELMAMAAEADPQAFRVVVERHGDVAFSLAYRMCGTRNAAEEVTQEAFLALWRTTARYDPARGSVRTWVLSVVHNRAIDALRAHGRRPRHAPTHDGEPPAYLELAAPERTDAQALANVQRTAMHAALQELPPQQRQTLELAYFGGFSQSEIAELLDDPLGTVKSRMRLGLEKLRELSHEEIAT